MRDKMNNLWIWAAITVVFIAWLYEEPLLAYTEPLAVIALFMIGTELMKIRVSLEKGK